jgi:hypothetical protein
MSEMQDPIHAAVPEAIIEYRYTVYFENLALWKEQDPTRRVHIARQLADWTATLAEMEAEEAEKRQQASSQNKAA